MYSADCKSALSGFAMPEHAEQRGKCMKQNNNVINIIRCSPFLSTFSIMEKARVQPKNKLQIDLSEQDILHTIEFEPEHLLRLEKLSTTELSNFRFILPFGEYMFELADTNFVKQAVKDNALRVEYYDIFEDSIVIRSGEGDTNSTKLIEVDP